MEFEKVFSILGVVLVAIISVFSFIGNWNSIYGEDVGNSASATYTRVGDTINTSMFILGLNSGNQTQTESGSGSTSVNSDLVGRALAIITLAPRMLGLIPDLMQDFGVNIIGIPAEYIGVAAAIFSFSFAILFAYLLIIGVRRLL